MELGARGRSGLLFMCKQKEPGKKMMFFTMEICSATGTPGVSSLMPFAQDARVDLFGSQVS